MQDITYLYDAEGKLCAVQISPSLWRIVEAPTLKAAQRVAAPPERPEPLEDWEEFKQYWDFQYPFNAEVECKHCGARSENWTDDPERPFLLRNAHLGGLLVFRCTKCGAGVRKKHFKDHFVYEVSPPGSACGC